MEEDQGLKEAVAECSKIIEAKCGKMPYMIVVAKADIKFDSQESRKKGIASGTASYMYFSRPPLKKNGLSKLLIDTTRHALNEAEKKAVETD
jgi:hypothetical protein